MKVHSLEVVEAIAAELGRLWEQPEPEPMSLARGDAGLALLPAYRARALARQEDRQDTERCLRQAIATASEGPLDISLYSALTGLGWVVEHLRHDLRQLDADAVSDEIDESLDEFLVGPPEPAYFDLIGGLVGCGVYVLERLPRPATARGLGRIVDRLAELAVPRREGVAWWTDPAWVLPETRRANPDGYYDLGLAHGSAGVIALLGRACAAGVAVGKARPLLGDAVAWLLAQEDPEGAKGFPCWVRPDGARRPARLAWCYGDLGIAVALLEAARCVREPAWEDEAVRIARRAAARPAERAGVIDAGLCHGAAGVAHLFNRLYQATGEAPLAEAARFWFRRTLELRHPERGLAGYAAFRADDTGAGRWVAEPGFLEGAAGVALALLAACTPCEPNWDRVLLTSISGAVV